MNHDKKLFSGVSFPKQIFIHIIEGLSEMNRDCTGWEKEIPHFVRNDRVILLRLREEVAIRNKQS